ncbi:MAG: GAF domain-containing protein [Desulfarculaceae bacterium]|jgi:signal transduction histidine kinase
MSEDRRFELLAHVVEIANSSVDVDERLDAILGAVSAHFDSRGALLFLQEQGKGKLSKANTWPRSFGEPGQMSVDFGVGKLGETALRREPLLVATDEIKGDPALDALCRPGELAAVFPVQDDNRLYAVLLLILAPETVLGEGEVRLLQMVAREMAGSIRNFRLYFEAKKRIAELNVLSDLGRAAVSTIEADELLKTVAGICSKLLGAKGGLVHVCTKNGQQRQMRAVHGKVPKKCLDQDLCKVPCSDDEQNGPVKRARTCNKRKSKKGQSYSLCVPLSFKGNYEGHLCVFEKAPGLQEPTDDGFSQEDQNLLTTMASMVSAALENALAVQRIEDLAQRNEEMVGALATLIEISTVLMTTVDFDETVQIILYAVTHPAGLDHDRVILFLVNEEDKVLRAVADMAQSSLPEQTRELAQTLADVRKLADTAGLGLDEDLMGLEVELEPETSILARTVIDKRPFIVNEPTEDPNVSPQFIAAQGPHPFVAVPMFAKGKAVGVLVVNHAETERPFSDRDLTLLSMLANLGGLSVETSRLYQNLENANRELAYMRNRLLEADKLAALGEIAAGVAHEIRNPLVSIGGFTRRIRKKVGDESNIRPYLDVIIEEVTRLERTLNEMLDFSTDARDNYEEHDLNAIMDDALELLQRELTENRIEVVTDFSPELPKVYCDDRQIKHVFFNILLNSVQAMNSKGGTLSLRTFAVMREGKQFVAGEVSDSGGGINMEVIHNIFNPFFTTKDSGSGLGLSIVHKIVTRHFGQVEVHNREGEGASFVVTLPAAEEGRAYLK